MKKLILCLTFVSMMCIVSCSNDPEFISNGVFEIISCSNERVEFKAVVETKFYSLALISDDRTVEAKRFSNSVGSVRWANGATFQPGSSMKLPAAYGVGAMTLPAGTVMTLSEFSTPKKFKVKKIRFITEGTKEMVYDISKSSWDK